MTRRRWLHPRGTRLREWWETGEPASVTAHVESCERCAARIEAMAELDDGEGSLGGLLRDALAPPSDLEGRLQDEVVRRLDERERTRRDLALLGELFSAGVETAVTVLSPPPEDDDPPDERGSRS